MASTFAVFIPPFDHERVSSTLAGTSAASWDKVSHPEFEEQADELSAVKAATDIVYVLTRGCEFSSEYRAMLMVSQRFTKGKKLWLLPLDEIDLSNPIWEGVDFLREIEVGPPELWER